MKKLKTLLLAMCCAAGGCISVDYVGQKLSPLPGDQLVRFFNEGENYDPAKYAVLGRFTAKAPDGTPLVDIKEEIQEKARAAGAEAVKINSFKRVSEGVFYTNRLANSPDSYSTGSTSTTVGGDPVYTNSFGQTGQLQSTAEERYVVVVQGVFLADATELEQALAQRRARHEAEAAEYSDDPEPPEYAPPLSDD